MKPIYLGREYLKFQLADGTFDWRYLYAYRGADGERRYALTEADARAAVEVKS